MFRKLILSASLGLSALATLAPTAASAQSYGSWNAPYGSADGYQDRRYDDHGRYRARQRWIAHHRWEQEERRREWQREHWRGGDDLRDGWNHDRGRGDDRGDY